MLRLLGCTTAAAVLQLGCLLHDRPAQANRDSGLTTAVETVASRIRLCSDLWRQRLQDLEPRQRQRRQDRPPSHAPQAISIGVGGLISASRLVRRVYAGLTRGATRGDPRPVSRRRPCQ